MSPDGILRLRDTVDWQDPSRAATQGRPVWRPANKPLGDMNREALLRLPCVFAVQFLVSSVSSLSS